MQDLGRVSSLPNRVCGTLGTHWELHRLVFRAVARISWEEKACVGRGDSVLNWNLESFPWLSALLILLYFE